MDPPPIASTSGDGAVPAETSPPSPSPTAIATSEPAAALPPEPEPDWVLGNPVSIVGRAAGEMVGGWMLAWLAFGVPFAILSWQILWLQNLWVHFPDFDTVARLMDGEAGFLMFALLLGPIALLLENVALGVFGYLFVLVELPLGFFAAMEPAGPDRTRHLLRLFIVVVANTYVLRLFA